MAEEREVKRDAFGRWLPGGSPNSSGRPRGGKALSDLIRLKFAEPMEVWFQGKLTKLERREIMADSLAQLISTGRVQLPDRIVNGKVEKGIVFDYNGDDWLKHLIKVLRYVEPPVQEVEVSGGVDGVVFDREFFDQAMITDEELEKAEDEVDGEG